MHLIDLLRLVFENLNRRKARVGLTSLGVMIGTAAVVILVSLAIGLQRNATQQLYGINDLTQIQVWPNYGEGGPVMKEGGNAPPQQQLITDESLVELGAIPGVVAVIPRDYIQGQAMFKFNRLETYAGIMGAGVDDLSILGLQAQEGSLVLEKGCVIIGALVPRNFYDPRLRPGQEMPEPPELYGKTLKLVLSKWDQEGNEIKKNLTICVSGIIMESRSEADWSIYMRMEEVTSFNEWFWGRRINRKKDGYSYAIVKAESVKQVMNVAEAIKNLGYNASTILEAVQSINSFFSVLQVVFGGIGAIALLVAAIGIANTMTMAILERTREIGLMKAVGATNRDVLSVFLGEAAGIGLLGGVGGICLGWIAGQVINVVAVAYLAGQAVQQGGTPPNQAVATPVWLPVFALVFAIIIGVLSGLYPALRAANLVPVTALKYE